MCAIASDGDFADGIPIFCHGCGIIHRVGVAYHPCCAVVCTLNKGDIIICVRIALHHIWQYTHNGGGFGALVIHLVNKGIGGGAVAGFVHSGDGYGVGAKAVLGNGIILDIPAKAPCYGAIRQISHAEQGRFFHIAQGCRNIHLLGVGIADCTADGDGVTILVNGCGVACNIAGGTTSNRANCGDR